MSKFPILSTLMGDKIVWNQFSQIRPRKCNDGGGYLGWLLLRFERAGALF